MRTNIQYVITPIKTANKVLKIRLIRVKSSTDFKIEEYLHNKWGKRFFLSLCGTKKPHLALLRRTIEDGYL